ncbi:hypothetical protein LCGC14_2342220 [marine sediment metagenome]|uniref:Uncharacterized protein n=1 Tax=marine sediment metagenome TaxID=412755 RepID=A0A0F9CZB1_9ZZZZ
MSTAPAPRESPGHDAMRNVKLPQAGISCQAGDNATRGSLAGGGVSSPDCRRSLWWCRRTYAGSRGLTTVYH